MTEYGVESVMLPDLFQEQKEKIQSLQESALKQVGAVHGLYFEHKWCREPHEDVTVTPHIHAYAGAHCAEVINANC